MPAKGGVGLQTAGETWNMTFKYTDATMHLDKMPI